MTPENFRPTPCEPDDDPYLWLEEQESAAALAWAEANTATTLMAFGDDRFVTDRNALKAIIDCPDKPLFITRGAGRLFNFWQDAANPRGVWRATSMEKLASASPDWDILLDLDRLADDEGEDWVWNSAVTIPGTHDRAIIRLSRGGGDATTMREFDLTKRAFAPDGFHLSEAKAEDPVWVDQDTLLITSSLGEGMANASGYPRTVRLWRRGTDAGTAPVIFETNDESHSAYASVEHDGATERVWFFDGAYQSDVLVWLGDYGGPKYRVDIPLDAIATSSTPRHGDWLALKLRTPWAVGGTAFPADAVVGISLRAFLAGSRRFTTLFEPGPRRVVNDIFWCGGRLHLCILDDMRHVFEVLTPSPTGWSREYLSGLPEIGMVHIRPLDQVPEESNGDLLARAADPLTPPSLFLLSPGTPPRLLTRSPAVFNTDGLVVSRHEAVSTDGTRVPYVQVGKAGEVGDVPVLMTGYGGFGISLLADYDIVMGKLWLERGGTVVVANIRGGGEFGAKWHQAGRREGKWLSHNDFAAIAEDLVTRGVTRPRRIAAEGGSNGGLLVANMLTRYPERFGAIFCSVPMIDMRRFTKMGGRAWTDEYGNPDKPEDWRFLAGISAYHTAEPGKPYPPILIATNRSDDRVHCGHGRKLVAKLQAMGYGEAYFYEPATGGHACGTTSTEVATFMALGLRFLRHAIGWEPVVPARSP